MASGLASSQARLLCRQDWYWQGQSAILTEHLSDTVPAFMSTLDSHFYRSPHSNHLRIPSLSFPPAMEHDMPPDIRDNNSQDPEPIDERIRIADDFNNSSRDTITAVDGPEQPKASSLHGTTAENGRNLLSPVEEALPHQPGKKQPVLFAPPPQSASAPVLTGMCTSLSATTLPTSHFS